MKRARAAHRALPDPRARRRRQARALVVGGGVTGLVATCLVVAPAADASTTLLLRLRFTTSTSSGAPSLSNSGTADVASAFVTAGGGQDQSVAGRSGQGLAAGTPSYRAGGQRAVIRLVARSGDPLSPGTADFSFGADVWLDGAPTSSYASSSDNGDNVVQRGLFNGAQYKLQLDSGKPSCRVKGSSGAVMVRGTRIARNTWYGMTCSRQGSTLTLTVVRYASDGSVVSREVSRASGSTGSVRAASPTVPFSVGGKLQDNGSLAAQSDQLNGRVDNVFLQIG